LDVAGTAKITGNLDMNSTGKIVQLVNPTNNQDAATKYYVDTSIPIGGIIMWSGTTGTSLPSNWKLCDGTTYNGIKTPDLRGRFVLSSGQGSGGLTNRTVDATGGVETVTLTEAQMPQHKHDVGATTTTTDGTHTHSITDPGHTHGVPSGNNATFGFLSTLQIAGATTAGSMITTSKATGITVDNTNSGHGHIITVTENNKGSTQTHENMPPFYVLAFIMRVS
jgi:microcystin-dependent protein